MLLALLIQTSQAIHHLVPLETSARGADLLSFQLCGRTIWTHIIERDRISASYYIHIMDVLSAAKDYYRDRIAMKIWEALLSSPSESSL